MGRTLGERILVPYPVESQLSGIERHEDRMWYRRTFTVPAGWKVGDHKRLQLNFGAVDWQAEVYVNGTRSPNTRAATTSSRRHHRRLKPGRTQELIVASTTRRTRPAARTRRWASSA